MPTYHTLPETADLMQSKTHAFKIIPVSDDIDLGLFWQKAGGSAAGRLKVTIVKQDGATTVEKLSDTGDVQVVNTDPPKIKILIAPADIDQVGELKIYPEFKFDDSWVQADMVSLTVKDDPIPG